MKHFQPGYQQDTELIYYTVVCTPVGTFGYSRIQCVPIFLRFPHYSSRCLSTNSQTPASHSAS